MRDYGNDDRNLLAITTAPVGRASLITVSGEVDMHTAPQLRAEIGEVLAERAGPVVLDLTAVTFVGSAGIAILVEAYHEAQQRGRSLAVVADHSTIAVIQPLHTAGLANLITSYSILGKSLTRETPP
jgi:anti-sigma B factor antagonist